MAKTSKGIYYPYNYNEIADVPEDMKQMAESINKILEDKEVDETTQDAKITILQNKVVDLQQENTDLANNMPWNTVSGESLHIEDSAKYSKNSLSISGNLKQEKRSGKNLFKLPVSATSNGVTLTNNGDGSFTLNGTTTGIAIFSATLNNPLKIGTYTLSYKSSIALGNDFFLRVRDKDNTLVHPTTPVSQVVGNDSTYNTATYTSDVESAIVAINLTKTDVTYNNVVIYVQLEEGSVATDFEPYGAMPSTEFPSMPLVATGVQKISRFGENLFNLNDKKSVDSLFTIDADKWISVTYNNTGTSVKYVNYKTYKSNKIKANTNYALFLEVKNVSGTGSIYLSSDGVIGEKSQFSGNTSVDFSNINSNKIYKYTITSRDDLTLTEINTMLRSFVKFNAGQSGSITFRISVLEDTTVTTDNFKYEPYWEEINTLDLGSTELCKITDTNGNVIAQDRAVFRNEKWQWEKNVEKKVLNGTEAWATRTAGTDTYGYRLANIFDIYAVNGVCNYFNFIKGGSANTQTQECVASANTDTSLNIFTKQIETLDKLKQMLTQENMVIYSNRATPQYIDCTAEQSAVLDKLYNNFKLAKGVNNVMVESENGAGVEMELDYMQDNILKDKKLEERITALENLLSTTQTSALLLDNLQNDLESEVN